MSWRSSKGNDVRPTAAAMLVAVVATLLLLVGEWAVPCAGLQCSVSGFLANTTLGSGGSIVPSVAQRMMIGNYPITITSVSAYMSCSALSPYPVSSPSLASVYVKF
jgi:hypothetical protein